MKVKKNAHKSIQEKFRHLTKAVDLEAEDLGAYCRKEGILLSELESWRADFMQLLEYGFEHNMVQNLRAELLKTKTELYTLAQEEKKLKKELNRKDAALAEASALLVLKKKAELIWGVSEET